MRNNKEIDKKLQPETEKTTGKKVTFWLIASLITIFIFCIFLYLIPFIQEIPSGDKTTVTNSAELKRDAAYKKLISLMNRDVQRLSRKYNAYTSGQSYLVINTTDNLFHLYRNKKQIREGFCSSGSYKLLQTEEGRSWIFKTPKGKFLIQGKTIDPIWTRPDWAFVEEGLPIPPKDDPSRYEYGVLGDYAMSLGEGYLIHGTIYKRFIGMPVTHGCVRLNDDDLKAIFNTLSIGSKVYIF
ncbi:MAG: L,D-transpeptidase [Bacteroidales bacterium]|nr:L,D-transpeptidase [Bacteroidales bacterium]